MGTVTKKANLVDVHVGLRIRAARLAAGLSQERLGNALGVTFQQVQKYEKGANRVGAGRLSDIARVLSVPVSYFFESDAVDGRASAPSEGFNDITVVLSTAEGMRIARALARIPDPETRRRIADLLEAMIERETRRSVA
ncbi:MAG: helix-turn-helix transcriptional regulator [Alphaproteobacteria bacterium]|nr:helix-turn-helix transcriptional regulator [Alphaproteobacteria bacterium]